MVASLSHWASTVVEVSWQHVATIDEPWRNFSSPEYQLQPLKLYMYFINNVYFLQYRYKTATVKHCHKLSAIS